MDDFLCFLIVWMSIGLSSATYIIDDSNTTVQYFPSNMWTIDHDLSYYNGTVRFTSGICNTSLNCTMTIPFIGSGITLKMIQWYPCNLLVSIDGSAPTSISFPQGDHLYNSNIHVNFTAYDKQSLQSGSHILNLLLVDTESISLGYPPGFWFDYAIVNETNAFSTPATPSNTVLHPTHSVTAAAVGGTLGGIAMIVAGILISVCILKAERSQLRPDSDRKIVTSNDYPVELSVGGPSLPSEMQSMPATLPTTWQPAHKVERGFDSDHKMVTSNDYPVELSVGVPSLPSEMLSTPATLPTTWQPAHKVASSEQRDLTSTSTSTPRDVAQYSTTATSSALPSLSSTSINPLPEEAAALIHRLRSFGLPPGDITRLIGILNGRNESTFEDVRVLQRPYTLNVPAEDVNLIVAAMQRLGQNHPSPFPVL